MPGRVAIPTIDISPFQENPDSVEAQGVVKDVDVLKGAAAFFALPMEEKRKIDRAQPNSCGKGFEVMKTQEQKRGLGGDLKEGFYVSADVPRSDPLAQAHPHFVGPNKWLPPDVQPYSVFKDPVDKYMLEMHRVIRIMFRIIAAGMPYGPNVFDEFLSGVPLALLSPKHYPPVTQEGLGCGAHTDFGAMTLLLQDKQSGLQVFHEDEWIDVIPNQDAYVVNTGDMLQRLTRGQYKSTVHRVLAPKGDTHRYSLPFFFNGNVETKLVPFDGIREGDKVLTVEEHMLERFMRTFLQENKEAA